jgi:hypothetical protein
VSEPEGGILVPDALINLVVVGHADVEPLGHYLVPAGIFLREVFPATFENDLVHLH